MEPPETIDVDRPVVHPDALQLAGASYRLPDVEHGLVEHIEYVAHYPTALSKW